MGEDEVASVLKYLDVLVDTYPGGISQRQLADKVGVSEAAVSQSRKKLVDFVSKDRLIWKELVLSSDSPVITKIARTFISNKMTSRFFTSKYGKAFLRGLDVHGKLSQAFPLYSEYFSVDDTGRMVGTAIAQLSSLDQIERLRFPIGETAPNVEEVSAQMGRAMGAVFSHLNFTVKSEKDLLAWLGIRDKWFFLIERTVSDHLPSLSILSAMDENSKRVYLDVYRKTLTFYLRKAFLPMTKFLEEKAQEGDVVFSVVHEDVGSVWSPEDRHIYTLT